MDPITPVIERCEKRLEEVRAILARWTQYDTNRIDGQRAQLQREEMDLVTILKALEFYRASFLPGGPEE